ncbi:MAG: exo-alpha-sialidase [Candidatus Hydrogenedentes bacterium]|nr:exo-alpha-sialidase [Candidatus Hydrogenedentota bacterium]
MQPWSRVLLLVVSIATVVLNLIATADTFTAVDHERKTIYHSPQTPGYTCWVGAWVMPDGSAMVSFTQATGPIDGRPQAPLDVQKKLNWPPAGHPAYDMTGLDLHNVHLRSTDFGRTWEKVSADPFQSCMNGVYGEAETALPDGSILRAACGYYLPYNPDLPKTGYLERSTDRSKTWGKPEIPLPAEKYSTYLKRIRVLRDGRVIVTGGVAQVPANSLSREDYSKHFEPLLIVSNDKGKTWSKPIPVVPVEFRKNWGGEEFDIAELPTGDLLCVFRRMVPEQKAEARWQGILKKSGESWTPGVVVPAPFPHSGHPELLATQEGPILHLATSGVHYTSDAGESWQMLDVPGTAYYPRAIQMPDGQILVFAHVGSDDPYGAVDQSIVMDSFRLKPK